MLKINIKHNFVTLAAIIYNVFNLSCLEKLCLGLTLMFQRLVSQ